jgi:hypothetical protein
VDGCESFCSVLIIVELCSLLLLVNVFGEAGNMWR